MSNYRYALPSASALYAFECVGRYGNFSRAAQELGTSQPAVSRHIASLEAFLGVRLLVRGRGRTTLTPEGRHLYQATLDGLETIAGAVRHIRQQRRTVSIACTYAIAHLWLMPRHEALQRALGEDVEIVVQSSEYEYHDRLREEGIDICLTFAGEKAKGGHKHKIFAEAVIPVCSPGFADDVRDRVKHDGVPALTRLPLLNLGQPNYGWLTWGDWFERQSVDAPDLSSARRFGNYVYLLEAACAGAGVALAWRGLADAYIELGRLQPVFPEIDWIETDGGLSLVVNPEPRDVSLVISAVAALLAPAGD